MSIDLLCDELPLAEAEVVALWERVRKEIEVQDGSVVLKCVSREEIRALNKQYRGKDSATNVLSFSYGDGTHDVALSLEVARREADERGAAVRDYCAWLVVHGLLHVAGFDHERSQQEAQRTRELERTILQAAGFQTDEE